MYILAVETSTSSASAACLKDGKVTASRKEEGKYAHNQLLFDMIKEVLDQTGISIREVDVFAVGTGPGSFTGLRVGASAVKGLSAGSGKRIIPVPSIDAAALKFFKNYPAESEVTIVLDGKQSDFFHASYSYSGKILEKKSEIVVHPYEFCSYIRGNVAGNVMSEKVSFEKYYEGTDPDAENIAELACMNLSDSPSAPDFEPCYYKDFKVKR